MKSISLTSLVVLIGLGFAAPASAGGKQNDLLFGDRGRQATSTSNLGNITLTGTGSFYKGR